jgi:hypothetical protein
MHPTLPLLEATDFPPIRRDRLETLQVNLGYMSGPPQEYAPPKAGRSWPVSPPTITAVRSGLTRPAFR